MPPRTDDWFHQAERDLAQAEVARGAGHHEWACFAAHQAAEKAVKALHLARGQEAWGHVVARLLEDLPSPAPAALVECARSLDAHYVPTRYPNGFPAGAPYEHYGPRQSEEALEDARQILGFVRTALA